MSRSIKVATLAIVATHLATDRSQDSSELSFWVDTLTDEEDGFNETLRQRNTRRRLSVVICLLCQSMHGTLVRAETHVRLDEECDQCANSWGSHLVSHPHGLPDGSCVGFQVKLSQSCIFDARM